MPRNVSDVSPHYNVIAGIRKTNGVREFYALDPWYDLEEFWYTESQMKALMEINQRYPFWIWYYTFYWGGYDNSCYVGIMSLRRASPAVSLSVVLI
jgi:hypothetical protein